MPVLPKEAHMPPPPPLRREEIAYDDEEVEKKSGDDDEDESEMVKVYLRLRPHSKAGSNDLDFSKAADDALVVLDDCTVETIAPEESQSFKNRETGGKYKFSRVFDKPTDQEELFQSTTEQLVHTLADGKDGLLFAYGVTNAGKTYTVEGTETSPGLIPRALDMVFDRIAAHYEMIPGFKARVEISYLQVYNEQVHDLQSMRPGSFLREKLRIKLRDDGVEVEGLKSTPISCASDGMSILIRGREVRATHETQCNLQSSRSHSVFVIQLEQWGIRKEGSKVSKLYIVDLAGSERTKRTMTSRVRQREASNINCSLMNLMRCLDTLRLNQKNKRLNKREKMVPFRESKLTLLFRDCFVGGNCGGVAMIVNASSRPEDYDETAHALKYGALVKNVKVARMVTRRLSNHVNYGLDGRRQLRTENKDESSRRNVTTIGTEGPQGNQTDNEENLGIQYLDVEMEGDGIPAEEHPVLSALLFELADARMRCVSMEAEIREEVGAEMAKRLEEMEAVFKKRVDAAKQISDNKSELLLKNIRKRMVDGGKNDIYTMDDIEALVQSIKECEEEMDRMRQLHVADTSILQREVEQLRAAAGYSAPGSSIPFDLDNPVAKENRRKSTEAHRKSLERLDRLVVEQLDTISRFKEELAEERALHEKTIKQLESATQLAKDAQIGEAEAERQLLAAKQENENLRTASGHNKRGSTTSPSSFIKQISSPRIPLRAAIARKVKSKREQTRDESEPESRGGTEPRSGGGLSYDFGFLRNHSSAPASDSMWSRRFKREPHTNESDGQRSARDNSPGSANKPETHSRLGIMTRMVEKIRNRGHQTGF